jgi:histidyl-tRNA synthetase
MTKGRRDESGDFTKGAGLDDESAIRVLSIFEARGANNEETCGRLDGGPNAARARQEGVGELREIANLLNTGGYGDGRIVIDPSVVRGLEYYTGPVYEVELTFESKDDEGRPIRFGSVGGGGRYDGLVARFRGESVPATGFSIGVSRLLAALQHLGKIDSKPEPGPVVVTVFDRARMADYQGMVKRLRDAGIRAELYLGNPRNMGNQFKYADKRNSPCVIIQGGDEKAKGQIQVKDLIEGAKAAAAIGSNQEWRESRPAQFAVPEEGLVDAVREVLARHGIAWT